MLQEKYYEKQRLKTQQTGYKNWWKTTSEFLELNKLEHTFDNILNSFESLPDFVKNANERFINFSHHLNPLPAQFTYENDYLFGNTIPLQLSPDTVLRKLRKIICD